MPHPFRISAAQLFSQLNEKKFSLSERKRLVDKFLAAEIKRITLHQWTILIDFLRVANKSQNSIEISTSIHNARKCVKRLRALAYFFKSILGKKEFKQLQFDLNSITKPLSELRDAEVLSKLFQELNLPKSALPKFDLPSSADATNTSIQIYEQISGRIKNLPWQSISLFHIRKTIKRAWKKSQKTWFLAESQPENAKLYHQARRQAKYLWYFTEICRDLHPNRLLALATLLDKFTDALGRSHDFAIAFNFLAKEEIKEQEAKELCRARENANAIFAHDHPAKGFKKFYTSTRNEFRLSSESPSA